MSYTDPEKIFDPNAQSLTDEEADDLLKSGLVQKEFIDPAAQFDGPKKQEEDLLDSYRHGRQFIKSIADPPTESAILKLVKTLPLCRDCRPLFKDAVQTERPPCATCFHLFKTPKLIKDAQGVEHYHFGWYKPRGEFPTNGVAENEIRGIMKDHDTYTKTELLPKGVFAPLTTCVFNSQEAMQKMYDKDVKNQSEIEKAMVEMERKKEEALVKMQEETEPGSLEDYIRKKVKQCTAEVKLKKAKEIIEQFTPVYEKLSGQVSEMEAENTNYPKAGLKLYQDKMAEIGYPTPTSFYDNITIGV